MGSAYVGGAMRCSSSQLIAWVNTVLQLDGRDCRSGPISCLRETATGCFYAQILDALLPGKIRMNGVVWGKHGGVLEHEVTNNFKIIAVALHGAGVERRIDFDAMLKARLTAVLEFTQWLKNVSSNPFFSDRIRCYDAARRRAFCKQSIRGQAARKIDGGGGSTSRGRSRSKSRSKSRSSSSRRRSRMMMSNTGDSRILDVVKEGGVVKGGDDDTERETIVSDCNSRCRTAFNGEEAVLYTTAGHGLPYRRTLRARKIPAPGASHGGGGGGGGSSGDAGTTRSRHPTVALRAGRRPEKEGVHHDGDNLRWVWPQGQIYSRPDIGHPPSDDKPRRPSHGLGRREVKKGRCGDKGDYAVAVRDQGGSKRSPSPSSPLESVVWDHELVVHHPRLPAGCELRVEITPDDAAAGARRLESLFNRETAEGEDGDDPNDRPAIVLGSMRGIRSNGGGSSVVKFFLTASGDTTVGDGGGGGGGGRCDHASWPPLSVDSESCATKLLLLPVPLRGKGKGVGERHRVEEEEHAPRHARVWGDDAASGGKIKPRESSLAVTETLLDCHNNGWGIENAAKNSNNKGDWRGGGDTPERNAGIENGAKNIKKGGWRGGGDNPEGNAGCCTGSAKGASLSFTTTASEGVERKLRPSPPPPLPLRRRRFGAGGAASAALLARTRRLHSHLAA